MLNDFEKKNTGFINLWRCITGWEWYTDVNTFKLFMHCLLKANHKDKSWQGIKIKRGSFITSLDNLVFETGLTKMQVRTSIKKLKLTHEITYNSTSRYSVITVNNYNSYQPNNTQVNTQITYKQHTDNTQITLTNNDNNDNNVNNNINSSSSSSCISDKKTTSSTTDISDLNEDRIKDLKNFYGEYNNVHLTSRQLDSLKAMILNDSILNNLINQLSENIEQGKEKLYDEKTPAIHFVRLKKYWQYQQNKTVEKNKKQQVDEEYNFGIG